MTQYIGVRYWNGGPVYTHHNDGDPLAIGDKVEVETKLGKRKGLVDSIADGPPDFSTRSARLIESAADRAERKAREAKS